MIPNDVFLLHGKPEEHPFWTSAFLYGYHPPFRTSHVIRLCLPGFRQPPYLLSSKHLYGGWLVLASIVTLREPRRRPFAKRREESALLITAASPVCRRGMDKDESAECGFRGQNYWLAEREGEARACTGLFMRLDELHFAVWNLEAAVPKLAPWHAIKG